MKKILITFEDYYEIANYLAETIKKRGFEVDIFISNKNEHWINKTIFRKIDKIARNLRLVKKGTHLFSFHRFSYKKYLDSQFEKSVKKFKPDLIFCIHGQRFGEDFLSNNKVKKIGWWIEPDPDKKALVHFARPFDLYLSYDSEVVEYLKSIGINSGYQSHVAMPTIFYPISRPEFLYDIFFYGGWSEWREQVLYSAFQQTRKIALYGDKWLKKCTIFSGKQLNEIYKGHGIFGKKLNEVINYSKIVLNAQRLKGFTTGLDTRAFDVLAAGSLLLTDAPKDLSNHFEDGRHLIVYKNLNDLEIKIREILDEKIETKNIKTVGREIILKNYTYEHLSDRIISELEKNN